MPDAALLPAAETDTARDRLRAAIAKRNSRREAVRMAEATAARADALLREAESALAAFGNVDAECAAFRSSLVRQAVSSGGEVTTLDLPPHLHKRVRDRDAARARRDDIDGTKAQLAAELEMTKNTLSAAERAVSFAARDVLLEAAEHMAGRVYSARRALLAARDELSALVGLWVASDFVDGRLTALPIAAWVRRELDISGFAAPEAARQFAESMPALRAPTTEEFRRAVAALAEDADAPLPETAR